MLWIKHAGNINRLQVYTLKDKTLSTLALLSFLRSYMQQINRFAHLLIYYWTTKPPVLKTPIPPHPKHNWKILTGCGGSWLSLVCGDSEILGRKSQTSVQDQKTNSRPARRSNWTSVRVTMICMWNLCDHRNCTYSWPDAWVVASQEMFFLTTVTVSAQTVQMFACFVSAKNPSNSKYTSFNMSVAEACI